MDLIFILLGFFYYQIKSTFFIVFPNAILCDMLRKNGIVSVLIIFFILVFILLLFPLFTTSKMSIIPFTTYTSAHTLNMYMDKNFHIYTHTFRNLL